MTVRISALALACGLCAGGSMFLLTWWMIAVGGSAVEPTLLERMYPLYAFTPLGSLLGLAYGFIDGLIFGAALGWLYNRLTIVMSADGRHGPEGPRVTLQH